MRRVVGWVGDPERRRAADHGDVRACRRPLTPGAAVSVSAIDNLFRPEVVKVRAGTKLTFSNDGRNDHNVLPARLPEGAKPFRAEAARFKPGDVYEVTLDRPGTYRYYCSIHGTMRRGMIGAVIVVP